MIHVIIEHKGAQKIMLQQTKPPTARKSVRFGTFGAP